MKAGREGQEEDAKRERRSGEWAQSREGGKKS